MRYTRAHCIVGFLLGLAGLAQPGAQGVTIDMVPVGNPGNAADFRYDPLGFGAVDHPYLIGKYEVSNAQYREFLNTKAAVGDPYGLYNPDMATDHGGIERNGAGTALNPWVYTPKGGDPIWDSRPVNFVSFWDAARFANWLNNGQGNSDTESGAYQHLDDLGSFARQPGAKIFLPTEDEWYKAAYYDPAKPEPSSYWEYPTRSDLKPSNDLPPGNDLIAGSANYAEPELTPVGAYTAKPSTSPYGTYDQGGNLWEWNETVIDGFPGLRGGSFDNTYGTEASHRDSYMAALENRIMGFRVAGVPEPGSLALFALGAACLAWRSGFLLRSGWRRKLRNRAATFLAL